MNSTTFLYGSVLAALGCCLALGVGAANTGNLPRARQACAVAWACLGALALCTVAVFKARYPSLETAPRLAQWQIGATVAAGALLARVSVLRLNELQATRDAGEAALAARLERNVRLQLVTAGALLVGAVVMFHLL